MFQEIIIAGNLGRDPEMRYTPSGQAVASFSVATENRYTGKDGKAVKETTWFRISVWGKMAETCTQYLKKGSAVLVTGRLTPDENGGPRVWEGSDGKPRASFEINASNVRFLSRAEGRSEPSSPFDGNQEIEFG